MIKEAYCSFEVAKLLKEKGFECEKSSITAMYNKTGEFHSLSTAADECHDYSDFDEHDYVAPTLQMAIAWLRKCKVYVVIGIIFSSHRNNIYFNIDIDSENLGWNHTTEFYDNYEEAAEAALKYSLENLI